MAKVKHNETDYQDYLAQEAKAGRTPENDAELKIMADAYNKGTLSFHYDIAQNGVKTANIARYPRPNEFTNGLQQTKDIENSASVLEGNAKVKPAANSDNIKTTVKGPKNVDQDYHYDAKRGVILPNAREMKPEPKEQKTVEIVDAKPAHTKEAGSVLAGKGEVKQANEKTNTEGVTVSTTTASKDNIVRGPSHFDEDYKYNKERGVILPQFHQPKPEPKDQKAAEIVDAKPTWSRAEEGSVLSGHSGVKSAVADEPKVTKTGDTVCMSADEFAKLTGAKVAGGSVLSGKAGIASIVADTAENTFKAVKETHNNNIESLKGSFDGVADHLARLERLKNGTGQCYADGKDKINGYHGTLVNNFPEGHDRVAFGRWVKSDVAKKQFSATDLEKLKAIEESGGLFFVGDDDKGFKDAIMRVKSTEGVYYGCAKEYKNQDTLFSVDKGGAEGLKITDGRKIDENLNLLKTSCENIDKLDHRFGGSCSVINDETIAQLKKHKEELDKHDRDNNNGNDNDRDKDNSHTSGNGGSRGENNNDHGGGNSGGNSGGNGGGNSGGDGGKSGDNNNDNNNDNNQDNSAGLN